MKSIVVIGPSNVENIASAINIPYKQWLKDLAIVCKKHFDEVIFMPDQGTYVDFALTFKSLGGNIKAVIPQKTKKHIELARRYTDNYIVFKNATGWSYLNTHITDLSNNVLCLGYSAGSMLEICSTKYLEKYNNKTINIVIDNRTSSKLPIQIESELKSVSYFNNVMDLDNIFSSFKTKKIISQNSFYTPQTSKLRNLYLSGSIPKNNSTEKFLDQISSVIKNDNNIKLLDLGTGNGYVITQLINKNKNTNIKYWGIDTSGSMVSLAKRALKNRPNVIILKADNNKLPFESNSMDIITNKVSTNFSLDEIHRVLRPGGHFIFKEYAAGKGLVEITSIFNNRVHSKNPLEYLKEIQKLNFNSYTYQQYNFVATYTLKEINQILLSAPIIDQYKEKKDLNIIKKHFNTDKIIITSDPFIITAQK